MNTYGDAIFSPIYVTFEINSSHSKEFVGYALTRNDFIQYALRFQQGTVYERMAVSPEDFISIKCCFPDFAEQSKIAHFLGVLDKRIQAQEHLVHSLKKYKRGLLVYYFSQKQDNGCVRVRLNQVADFLQGLTYSPSDVAKTGLLVLRSSNIKGGQLVFDDCVYVNLALRENLKVSKGDVLMCVRNGSKALVGKTALITEDFPNTTWGAFMMIIRSKLAGNYIYHYLNSPAFFSQVFKDTGTATINQITKSLLNECQIMLPPSYERDQIDTHLSSLDKKIYAEEGILSALYKQKSAFLQQLFT